jgi:tetratricopeptide (TPR) repeat protein
MEGMSMSKKKKQDKATRSRENWKRRRAAKQSRAGEVSLPDRRLMERVLQQVVGGGQGPQTPLERAQALIYEAFESDDPEKRCQLAQRALAISSDCADAYVLLAEHADTRREALELYAAGVAAGERALGPEVFQEHVGHFWGLRETRPYMRAREGLAHLLWATGQQDEALAHLQDMLRLNPGDNQGLRYRLSACYLWLDRRADLARLLEEYADEGSATWAYARALLAFRDEGDTPEAQRLLRSAKAVNKHVPAYLLELKVPPQAPPDYYSPGQESEAIVYVRESLGIWKSTPQALDWLRTHDDKARSQKARSGQVQGISRADKQKLLALPQGPDVWQADVRQMPNWLEHAGRKVLPWLLLVTDPEADLILEHEVLVESPSPDKIWKALSKCMSSPAVGTRPAQLQVGPSELWELLRGDLEEVGIDLSVNAELDHVDGVFECMRESFGEKREPGLLDAPGVGPDLVGNLFSAAAYFYRNAPWEKLRYESALEVACDKFPGGPWYAIIMGQGGMTFGLTLYEDLQELRAILSGRQSEPENIRQTAATTVIFGSEAELPLPDLDAARRHDWEIAGPDAYPWVFRKEQDADPQLPSAVQIEFLEACLLAIPDFVARHSQTDTSREEILVATAAGETRLALAWVPE